MKASPTLPQYLLKSSNHKQTNAYTPPQNTSVNSGNVHKNQYVDQVLMNTSKLYNLAHCSIRGNGRRTWHSSTQSCNCRYMQNFRSCLPAIITESSVCTGVGGAALPVSSKRCFKTNKDGAVKPLSKIFNSCSGQPCVLQQLSASK